MPTDLHARAAAQEALLRAAAAGLAQALAEVREVLTRRHATPDTVDRADWGTALGASQHRDLAVAALDAVRAEQAATRAAIATIAAPADAATHETALRALLIDEASLRVQLRHARERVAAADTVVAELSTLVARAEAELAAAAARTAWGAEHHDRGDALRDALSQPPLDTVVADAAALRGGAEMTAATDRLDALVPTELRARAEQRAGEAVAVLDQARARLANVADHTAELDAEEAPQSAAVVAGEWALRDAEQALSDYIAGAAGRLAAAAAVLERAAALGDLSDTQVAAIAARLTDSGDALDDETALGTSLAALAAAQEDVDDAILAARIANPDVEPEDDPDVIDAREALAQDAIQDPVNAARTAYDTATRDALDALEVEVPPEVWAAVLHHTMAARALEELADGATRAALVQDLDDAEDQLAGVLDVRDTTIRARWHLGLEAATRAGQAAAAETTAAERRRHYVQGDGPSGRTPLEL